jgi:hypothetical protein
VHFQPYALSGEGDAFGLEPQALVEAVGARQGDTAARGQHAMPG